MDSEVLLNSIAEKNGYWDFRLTDGSNYINIYCDKTQKIITKAESNDETKDIAGLNFSGYNGVWMDDSFANKAADSSKMIINFVGKNQAHVVLTSSTERTGTAQLVKDVFFDFNQEAKLTGIDSSGNIIKATISFYEGAVNFNYLSGSVYKDKRNWFTVGFGSFVRAADYLNIQKSMKLLCKEYGFVDNNAGFYIPKTDDDAVYLVYEGKTDDGRYRIAVRYCRDTVIYAWYNIDPDTQAIEVDEW